MAIWRHAHTQFKTTSACTHPVQDCRTRHLHAHTLSNPIDIFMHTPSSRQSNPTSACMHPVQDFRTQHLNAHTQFKTIEPDICMHTPSSRLSNPTSACTHPVQDCRTRHLHAHTLSNLTYHTMSYHRQQSHYVYNKREGMYAWVLHTCMTVRAAGPRGKV